MYSKSPYTHMYKNNKFLAVSGAEWSTEQRTKHNVTPSRTMCITSSRGRPLPTPFVHIHISNPSVHPSRPCAYITSSRGRPQPTPFVHIHTYHPCAMVHVEAIYLTIMDTHRSYKLITCIHVEDSTALNNLIHLYIVGVIPWHVNTRQDKWTTQPQEEEKKRKGRVNSGRGVGKTVVMRPTQRGEW